MTDRFEPKEESIEDAEDYRELFENSILRVWHLHGRPLVVRIDRVTALETVIVDGGKRKKNRQPKLELSTRSGPLPLPLLLNKTNAKAIAQLYGKRPREWLGRFIELYPTTTTFGDETKECIRIRNQIPGTGRRKSRPEPAPLPPPSDPFDHDRATNNDDGTLEADGYEVTQ